MHERNLSRKNRMKMEGEFIVMDMTIWIRSIYMHQQYDAALKRLL
jgi:hypothetical protein